MGHTCLWSAGEIAGAQDRYQHCRQGQGAGEDGEPARTGSWRAFAVCVVDILDVSELVLPSHFSESGKGIREGCLVPEDVVNGLILHVVRAPRIVGSQPGLLGDSDSPQGSWSSRREVERELVCVLSRVPWSGVCVCVWWPAFPCPSLGAVVRRVCGGLRFCARPTALMTGFAAGASAASTD